MLSNNNTTETGCSWLHAQTSLMSCQAAICQDRTYATRGTRLRAGIFTVANLPAVSSAHYDRITVNTNQYVLNTDVCALPNIFTFIYTFTRSA